MFPVVAWVRIYLKQPRLNRRHGLNRTERREARDLWTQLYTKPEYRFWLEKILSRRGESNCINAQLIVLSTEAEINFT